MRSSVPIPLLISLSMLLPEASALRMHPLLCCTRLNIEFWGQGKVAYQQTPSYLAKNIYWSDSSYQTPTCIFSPTSASDVSKAVAIFSRNSCVFAIRGGSHMPNYGFSSTNSGVLMSLSGLNAISYDATNGLVDIGAGNRWTNVYDFLDPKGVTVLGARNSDVGVSGFILGGGISFLSNSYGWSTDNVVEFEVVLADGRIVHANSQQNTDLLRSLRGGSSNFGVVTSFTAKTYNVSANAAGVIQFPETSIPQLFDPLYNYIATGQAANPKYHIIPNFKKNGTQAPVATFTQFYMEHIDLANPPPVIKTWTDGTIPNDFNTVINRDEAGSLAKAFGAGAAPGPRTQWRVTSVIADAQLFKTIYSIWRTTSTPFESVPGFFNSIAMQPIGTKYAQVTQATPGGNALGVSGPLVVVSANIYWSNAADDAAMQAFLNDLFTKIKAAARLSGKFAGYEYLNYGAVDQSPIASYGTQSVQRLRRAKRKYDPNNVFGTLVEGGFKVPGF